MSRYELTISTNYVPHWGIYEAIRELFQNAIDLEVKDSNNKMDIEFESNNMVLNIRSKLSKLEKSSILLGVDDKVGEDNLIGKFGEGYKLALLILTRLGKEVIVYNYGAKEVWKPKIIKSKRYDSNLLVIDVTKYIFKSVPDYDLTFTIKGISQSEWDIVKHKTLFLRDDIKSFKTVNGEVLLNEDLKGHVYVSGLFVCKCDDDKIAYGYNVKPKFIELDRDRSLVDTFKLTWTTSKIWSSYEDKKFIADLIINKVEDVKYINYHYVSDPIPDNTFDAFQSKHGVSAIPVSNTYQLDRFKANYPRLKPIIVNESCNEIINKSPVFKEFLSVNYIPEKVDNLKQKLIDFKEKYQYSMSNDMVRDFDLILNSIEED